MEAVNRAQQMTGEIKGHYLNVTAVSVEHMYEQAASAKELGLFSGARRPWPPSPAPAAGPSAWAPATSTR